MLPVLIGIGGPELTADEEAIIRRLQPAGFILFSRNVEAVAQVRALTGQLRALSKHHPVIAIDQEGGRVVRTAALGLNLPSPAMLVKAGQLSQAERFNAVVELATVTGRALRCLGVNMNFAPVLDICHDPTVSNALPGRCWGDNAQDVISYAGVYAANLRRQGVMPCGKHFPGMGHAQADPHLSLPAVHMTVEQMMQSELLPFMTLCPELPGLMTAHLMLPLIDSDMPATLSARVIRGLLRDRIGYDGVVFTDDLCMGAIAGMYSPDEAALLSLQAGCDMPLICHDAKEWLIPLDERLKSLDDYVRGDCEQRLEKLSRCLCAPYPAHEEVWADCLNRAQALCDGFSPEADVNTPHSPVQRY